MVLKLALTASTLCSTQGDSFIPSAAAVRCAVAVCCQLELQSASRRFSLLDSPSSASASSATTFSSFPSDGHASYVVTESLVEPGLHCLVCFITYRVDGNSSVSASSTPLTYQKFFKFNVLPALSVTSVVHSRDDWLLAELTITNSTTRPLTITKVQIDTRSEQDSTTQPDGAGGHDGSQPNKAWSSSSSHFHVQLIGAEPSVSRSPLSPAADALLAPSASRACLFRLEPLSVDSRRVTDIGRVLVEWRQHMGELCHLTAACAVHRNAKTSSAQMAAAAPQSANTTNANLPPGPTATLPSPAFPPLPPAPAAARPSDVTIQLVSCPATAVLERPFCVRLLLSNPLPATLHRCQLLLMRDKMGSVLPVGRSRMYVGSAGGGEGGAAAGTVQPRSSHVVELTMAGIGLGVHKIGGLRVVAQSSATPPIQLDFDALQHIEIVAHE